jgi:hypothetical protein
MQPNPDQTDRDTPEEAREETKRPHAYCNDAKRSEGNEERPQEPVREPQIDLVVRQAHQIDWGKHWIEFLGENLGIFHADAERDDRPGVSRGSVHGLGRSF